MPDGAAMAAEPPNLKSRPDDGRGCPPGQGQVESNGGRIGQPPFVPTEAQRREVEAWAKAGLSPEDMGTLLGVSGRTVERHFPDEFKKGRIRVKAAIGAGLVRKALAGNLTAMIFYLRTQAKWNVRVEHTGADGGPIKTFDLGGLGLEEKRVLLSVIDQLLEQHGEGGADGDSAGNDQPVIN